MKNRYQFIILFVSLSIFIGLLFYFWSESRKETINEMSFRTFTFCSEVIKVSWEDSRALCEGYYVGVNDTMHWVDLATRSTNFGDKLRLETRKAIAKIEKGCTGEIAHDESYLKKELYAYEALQLDQAGSQDPLIEILAISMIKEQSRKCNLREK